MAGTERLDERAATRQWIRSTDSRYKELIADMWNDLRVRNRLVAGVDALTRIETHLTAKSRGTGSGSLCLQTLVAYMRPVCTEMLTMLARVPGGEDMMDDNVYSLKIDAAYIGRRPSVLQARESLRLLLLETHSRLQVWWVEFGFIVPPTSTRELKTSHITSVMVLCYPLLHTPQTIHNVYVYCIIFSALWNRE